MESKYIVHPKSLELQHNRGHVASLDLRYSGWLQIVICFLYSKREAGVTHTYTHVHILVCLHGHLYRADTLDLISPSQLCQPSAWQRIGTMGLPQETLRIERARRRKRKRCRGLWRERRRERR